MTFRAIRVLKEADLILAEDTRTSSVLLKHFEIKGRLESHHKFNEHKTASMIKERILSGLNVALISDAGTPGISDPGFLLVRTCVQEGIEVQTVTGEITASPRAFDNIVKASCANSASTAYSAWFTTVQD